MSYALGVDIGGTKIAAGLIEENGNCSYRVQMPSVTKDREMMFEQVVGCINELLEKSQLTASELKGIGIGVPGKVDVESGIAVYQNNLPWANFPLVERIKEHFPVENIIIDNDVYMAAFAEWAIRGKNPKETFVYFTISTGVSCCTIHHGNFIRGAGFAGEVGFLPVGIDPSNGQTQDLETIASGSGIAKLAQRNLSSGKYTGVENVANIRSEQVLQDFKNEQPYAIRTMEEILDYLARGLYNVSCLLDPDKLVIGGGGINHNPEFLDSVKASLEKYLSSDQADLLNRMNLSRLTGDAGLIGAGFRVHDII